jgi:hypothetical protein
VVQGRLGEFYVDHVHPFGAACASSNAGMIANALVDIWRAEGVQPLLKYEDDFHIFRFPMPDGPFLGGQYSYSYDRQAMLALVEPLSVPWHPEKGDGHFSSLTVFIGLQWDLVNLRVSLPESKRLKFRARVQTFVGSFEGQRCQLRDVEKLHGSLCYIAFVYMAGRSHLPSLSNFAASFKGNEHIHRYPPKSVITDLKWWKQVLHPADTFRQLTSHGPLIDMNIHVDASTSWGIGVIVDGRWCAFELAPGWKVEGRDICWLETLAVEFTAYILEAMGIQNCRVLIHSDNQGTIGSIDKGRSPNFHINLAVRRTFATLASLLITPVIEYVRSADNPADPISRGELGPPHLALEVTFKLPAELRHVFLNANRFFI